jgi:glycosyltransferase involved in cell wall biosynthesis
VKDEGKKVSIIIPFYNRIPLVLESIRSALDQTYRNIEVVLVNDGSTEDIGPIRDMEKSDNRIRMLTADHAGVSSARNLAIQKATGDYISFLDSDDLFKPDKVRIQLDYMLKHDYCISHTSYERIDMNGKPIGFVHSGNFGGRIYPQIIGGCMIATPTLMARTEVLLQSKGFSRDFGIGEDVCFWIDLASTYEFGALDIPLSKVRTSFSSAAYDMDKQILGLTNILNYCSDSLPHKGYRDQLNRLKALLDSIKKDRDKQIMHMKQFEDAYRGLLRKRASIDKRFMNKGFLPLVSIIIPVYNGGNYLQEAIESALMQTYPNTEVIIINDGSKDGGETESIALRYKDKIRYYYKENGGVASALNLGIEKMRGEYFSWLSHDDLYLEDKITEQIRLLSEESDKARIITGGYILFRGLDGTEIGQMKPQESIYASKLSIPLYPIFRGMINGCAMLIHKSHFERVGVFNESLPTTQDYDLWFRMLRGQSVLFQKGNYIKSRVHDQQGSLSLAHRDEAFHLWKYMMDHVTETECIQMEGSIFAFYKELYLFLYSAMPQNTTIWGYAKQKAIEVTMSCHSHFNHVIGHDSMNLIEEINSESLECVIRMLALAKMSGNARIVAVICFEMGSKYKDFLHHLLSMNPEYQFFYIYINKDINSPSVKTRIFENSIELSTGAMKEDTLVSLLHFMQIELAIVFMPHNIEIARFLHFELSKSRLIIVHEYSLNEIHKIPINCFDAAWLICALNKETEGLDGWFLEKHISYSDDFQRFIPEILASALDKKSMITKQSWYPEVVHANSVDDRDKAEIIIKMICSDQKENLCVASVPTKDDVTGYLSKATPIAVTECETCKNMQKTLSWRITKPLRVIRKVQIFWKQEGFIKCMRKVWGKLSKKQRKACL